MEHNDIMQKYIGDEIKTNHPVKNTIMIYEKCISNFRRVGRLYKEFKFKEADELLDRLEATSYELTLQVNEKASEELAKELYGDYAWIVGEIQTMKMVRNGEKVKGIEVVLLNLIEGFEGALKAHGEG